MESQAKLEEKAQEVMSKHLELKDAQMSIQKLEEHIAELGYNATASGEKSQATLAEKEQELTDENEAIEVQLDASNVQTKELEQNVLLLEQRLLAANEEKAAMEVRAGISIETVRELEEQLDATAQEKVALEEQLACEVIVAVGARTSADVISELETQLETLVAQLYTTADERAVCQKEATTSSEKVNELEQQVLELRQQLQQILVEKDSTKEEAAEVAELAELMASQAADRQESDSRVASEQSQSLTAALTEARHRGGLAVMRVVMAAWSNSYLSNLLQRMKVNKAADDYADAEMVVASMKEELEISDNIYAGKVAHLSAQKVRAENQVTRLQTQVEHLAVESTFRAAWRHWHGRLTQTERGRQQNSVAASQSSRDKSPEKRLSDARAVAVAQTAGDIEAAFAGFEKTPAALETVHVEQGVVRKTEDRVAETEQTSIENELRNELAQAAAEKGTAEMNLETLQQDLITQRTEQERTNASLVEQLGAKEAELIALQAKHSEASKQQAEHALIVVDLEADLAEVRAELTLEVGEARHELDAAQASFSNDQYVLKEELTRAHSAYREVKLAHVFGILDLDDCKCIQRSELAQLSSQGEWGGCGGGATPRLADLEEAHVEWIDAMNTQLVDKLCANGDDSVACDEFVNHYEKALPEGHQESEQVINSFLEVARGRRQSVLQAHVVVEQELREELTAAAFEVKQAMVTHKSVRDETVREMDAEIEALEEQQYTPAVPDAAERDISETGAEHKEVNETAGGLERMANASTFSENKVCGEPDSLQEQLLICTARVRELEAEQTVMQEEQWCYSALLILTRHAVFSKASEQTARQLSAKVEALRAKLETAAMEKTALEEKQAQANSWNDQKMCELTSKIEALDGQLGNAIQQKVALVSQLNSTDKSEKQKDQLAAFTEISRLQQELYDMTNEGTEARQQLELVSRQLTETQQQCRDGDRQMQSLLQEELCIAKEKSLASPRVTHLGQSMRILEVQVQELEVQLCETSGDKIKLEKKLAAMTDHSQVDDFEWCPSCKQKAHMLAKQVIIAEEEMASEVNKRIEAIKSKAEATIQLERLQQELHTIQTQLQAAEEKQVMSIKQRDEAAHHAALLEVNSDELESSLVALQLQLTLTEEKFAASDLERSAAEDMEMWTLRQQMNALHTENDLLRAQPNTSFDLTVHSEIKIQQLEKELINAQEKLFLRQQQSDYTPGKVKLLGLEGMEGMEGQPVEGTLTRPPPSTPNKLTQAVSCRASIKRCSFAVALISGRGD